MHIHLHLDDSDECKQQIAFADVLILNKTDLVEEAELDALEQRVRSINSMAKIVRAKDANVPITTVLDVGGFDLERAVVTKPAFLSPEYPFEWAGTFEVQEGHYQLRLEDGPDPAMTLVTEYLAADEQASTKGAAERALRRWSEKALQVAPGSGFDLGAPGSDAKRFDVRVPRAGRVGVYTQHLPAEFRLQLLLGQVEIKPTAEQEFAAGHSHDAEVTSVGIHLDAPVDAERLNKWLSTLLREKGADIFRMKGILNVAGSANRFVFQGVHMLLTAVRTSRGAPDRVRAMSFLSARTWTAPPSRAPSSNAWPQAAVTARLRASTAPAAASSPHESPSK